MTNDASSLPRKATAAATSPGCPNLPIGTWTRRRADSSASVAKIDPVQRRRHDPWGDGVDPDAGPGELDTQLAGEREDAALARRVGDLRRGRAHHRGGGRRVDDRAAAAFEHVGKDCAAPEVDPGEVDVVDAPPRLEADVQDRSRRRAGRCRRCARRRRPAVPGDDAVVQRVDLVGPAYVDGNGLAADLVRDRQRLLVQVRDHDDCALAREPPADGRTDAARTARDDGHAACDRARERAWPRPASYGHSGVT